MGTWSAFFLNLIHKLLFSAMAAMFKHYVMRLPYGFDDMVYAYRKGMQLVLTEMAMRQNKQSVGRFVRLQDTEGSRPTWGAWLSPSITSYVINVAPRANVRLYNAWGQLMGEGRGPNTSYLIKMGAVPAPFTLLSNTAIARVLVDAEHEEDGAKITLNSTIPLVNPYTVSTTEAQLLSYSLEPTDPVDLESRDYFTLLATLVAANPTDDKRILKGLNFVDSQPSSALELVRSKALNIPMAKKLT